MHTLDGVPTRLSLIASYDKSDERLNIDVQADEPGGGVVANLLGLPGDPAAPIAGQGRRAAAGLAGSP